METATQKPARAPLTLANGRVVEFTRESSGSQLATMRDGTSMTAEEWDEMCALLAGKPYP